MPFVNTYWIFFFVVIHVSSPQVDKVTYDGAQVWQVELRGAEDKQLIKKLIDSQGLTVILLGYIYLQDLTKKVDEAVVTNLKYEDETIKFGLVDITSPDATLTDFSQREEASGCASKVDISIWNLSPTQADFLVHGSHKVKVYRQLAARNLSHTVLIMDVQRKIDLESQQIPPSLWTETTLRVGHRVSWKKFPTLKIIEEYYNFLAEEYSSICRVQTIGYTAENRTIKMINITNGNPKNQVILITGGSHAREWVSVTSALYIMNKIVTKFDQQRNYIKNINWLIIPVLNPDGYVYTHKVDRLWRKNRREFTRCYGVDLNRNFDADWSIPGITETNECKATYSGPYPFSEAETRAIRELLWSLKRKPVAMMDLHSYGKLILFPWTARTLTTQDFDTHVKAAEEMRRAIFHATKANYTYGATYNKIYPATGTFLDWVYSEGVVHSYAIEIKDKGKQGFLVPPKEIENTGKELYAAVRSLSKYIKGHEKQRKSNDNQTAWF